jgi:hypothetical protein
MTAQHLYNSTEELGDCTEALGPQAPSAEE